MKIKITYLLILFCVQFGFSQTDVDFENVVKNFIKSVNSDKTDTFFDVFSEDLQKEITKEKLLEMIKATVKEFGNPAEFDFMLDDEGLKRYLIQTERDSFMIDISLSPELKVTQFKIE